MIEEYRSNFEAKWPVKYMVEVTSKQQAETLACCLIRAERYLRRRIPLGDFKNPNRSLADRLAVARRKLQEDAGLVASDAEVAAIVKRNRQLERKGAQRIVDLKSGKVKGQSEAKFLKSLDEAAANLKKGIASPPIALKEFLGRKKAAVGLQKIFADCPRPIPPSERTVGKRHVISPATASEIRKTLGITQVEMRNVLRAFKASGIQV